MGLQEFDTSSNTRNFGRGQDERIWGCAVALYLAANQPESGHSQRCASAMKLVVLWYESLTFHYSKSQRPNTLARPSGELYMNVSSTEVEHVAKDGNAATK